ncbi:MAG: hypothetical protein HY960_10615 [Ignavibacteriae bacterium]|nr:hypothetical protein [Ignavibacteriota bacterium]
MATLNNVTSALLSQMVKGCSQADLAVLEIAEMYKRHSLLVDFPIPKFSLEEVVVDLKVAFTSTPVSGKVLDETSKAEVVSRLDKYITTLVESNTALSALAKKYPDAAKAWRNNQSHLVQSLSDLLPVSVVFDIKQFSYSAAGKIRNFFISMLPLGIIIGPAKTAVDDDLPIKTPTPTKKATTTTTATTTVPPGTTWAENELINSGGFEDKVAVQIQEIVETVLKAMPVSPDRLDVLVTASELQTIATEKITSIKLTLREADQTWSKVEMPNGETREKIVPA